MNRHPVKPKPDRSPVALFCKEFAHFSKQLTTLNYDYRHSSGSSADPKIQRFSPPLHLLSHSTAVPAGGGSASSSAGRAGRTAKGTSQLFRLFSASLLQVALLVLRLHEIDHPTTGSRRSLPGLSGEGDCYDHGRPA